MKTTIEIGKEAMFKAIRELYNDYRLPKLNISQNEWNAFFNVTGEDFDSRGISDDYTTALNIVIRRALNMALINNAKEVAIDYLINALCDLHVFHIKTSEIEKIQKEIKDKIELAKSKKYIKK